MAEKKAKEVNIVDQNAIWRETIRKENRCQKLYTEYHINPYKVEWRKLNPCSSMSPSLDRLDSDWSRARDPTFSLIILNTTDRNSVKLF